MHAEHIPQSPYVPLTGFRSEQFAIAIDTGPIAVDEGHRITTDRTIRRRALVDPWKNRELDIVFIHQFASLPVGAF